jgi:hypothetical protein
VRDDRNRRITRIDTVHKKRETSDVTGWSAGRSRVSKTSRCMCDIRYSSYPAEHALGGRARLVALNGSPWKNRANAVISTPHHSLTSLHRYILLCRYLGI